jgi:hypothetical protein
MRWKKHLSTIIYILGRLVLEFGMGSKGTRTRVKAGNCQWRSGTSWAKNLIAAAVLVLLQMHDFVIFPQRIVIFSGFNLFIFPFQGRPGKELKTSSARTNCPAKLRLGRTGDHGWVVVEHNPNHNHELSESHGENRLWSSHNHLDHYTISLIRKLRENNVPITKLYSILGSFFGKMENVPTTKRCLKNLCQAIDREQAEGDIKKTLELFSEFRKDDPGFMYSIDPDDDGRIKTLMWTNSRSRMQYEYFGDAITFDTTYKTNKYEMPFGLFVGVNNHYRSVLLGGVLMTDESIDSFKWVFKEFAKLMGGRTPKTILTGMLSHLSCIFLFFTQFLSFQSTYFM